MTQIYYFSTPTCGPCKMFRPIVEKVSSQLGVNISYIDAQVAPDLTQQFGITQVPTIIVEKSGTTLLKITGVKSAGELTQILSQFK